MKTITIIVPCHNEEMTLIPFRLALNEVIDSIESYNWEILLINDGSSDQTINLMRKFHQDDSRYNYIDLSRNFGKENAMLAGFDYAKGDAIIIMDADLQDPPTMIPDMITSWEEGYDDVYAKRKSRGKESWLRKKLSLLFYKILKQSTRFEVLENVGDFRLLDRCCVNALKRLRETERYTKGMFCWIGFRKKELLFDRGDRVAGESNWNFWSLFNLAIEGITSFTTIPLRLASIIGAIVAIWAVIYMIWILFKTFVWGDPVAGYPTMMTVILFLGGVQLLALGVIGEYLGRVFNESKGRPVYLVRECNGDKVL